MQKKEGKMPRISSLDGLRGVMSLAVVWFHITTFLPIHFVPTCGWIAVNGFFILSGMLIFGQLRDGMPTRYFYWRRITSLVPVYATALIVVSPFITTASLYNAIIGITWRENIWTGNHQEWPSLVAHLWSLDQERIAYYIAPVIAYMAARKSDWMLLASLVFLTSASTLRHPEASLFTEPEMVFSPWIRMSGFAWAIIATWGPVWRLPKTMYVMAALASTSLIFLPDYLRMSWWWEMPVYEILTVITVQGAMNGELNSPFTWKPLVWLGERSYSLYVAHLPIVLLWRDKHIEIVAGGIILATLALYEVVQKPNWIERARLRFQKNAS